MIIKSFTAESASAAMKQVRKEMGGEAIVLKTRQLVDRYNRPQVEITACLEKPTVGRMSDILDDGSAPVNRLAPVLADEPVEPIVPAVPAGEAPIADIPELVHAASEDRLTKIETTLDRLVRMTITRGSEQIADPTLRAIVAKLRDADVPEDFLDEFLLSKQGRFSGQEAIKKIRAELVKEVSRLMVPDLKIASGDRVLFIGPAGAGKSSVMGKLAAQLVTVEKRRVTLAGVDFQKVAAYEELAGYADLLNVDVAELTGEKADKNIGRGSVVLIDSPALPIDSHKRDSLVRTAAKLGAKHRLLVFSAIMRSSDLLDLAAQYRWFAPTHLVATMLDLTRRQGSLIAAARAFNVRIAFVSNTTGGLGRLNAPDPAGLAATLTGTEALSE